METRKQKEIEHYDSHSERYFKAGGDFEGFNPLVLSSFNFCYQWLKKNCQNKKILDYGCGNGIHSVFPAKKGAEKVIGIDLSEKSLNLARERIRKERVEGKVEFLKMDCEKMEFPDNSFDIIFDGGTFSSLDLEKAFPELNRVLRPDGFLVGIETFGHNPFTNLKRKINKIRGKRTDWAVAHIFKKKDLKLAKDYFGRIEVRYFHLVSWIAFPTIGFPGAKFLLRFLESIDRLLLRLSFLRKFAFRIVFIFSEPKRYGQKTF